MNLVRFSILPAIIFCVEQADGQFIDTNVLNPQGYNHFNTDFWASGGAGIAEKGLSGAALYNPACITFDGLTLNVETSWRLKTEIFDLMEYDNMALLPSFFSAGMSVGRFGFEAGYSRTYDERLFLGNIPVTTTAQPDGTGEFIETLTRTSVQSVFGGFSYAPGDIFSAGMTLALDIIRREDRIWHMTSAYTGSRAHIVFGGYLKPNELLDIGMTVNFAPDINLKAHPPNDLLVRYFNDPVDSRRIPLESVIPSMMAKSPLRAEFGLGLNVLRQLRVMANFEFQNWTNVYSGTQNLWQIHTGALVAPLPGLCFRVGYFTQKYPIVNSKDYYDQEFVTVGASINILDNATVSLSYLTSRPFMKGRVSSTYYWFDESLQQEKVSAGIAYRL